MRSTDGVLFDNPNIREWGVLLTKPRQNTGFVYQSSLEYEDSGCCFRNPLEEEGEGVVCNPYLNKGEGGNGNNTLLWKWVLFTIFLRYGKWGVLFCS